MALPLSAQNSVGDKSATKDNIIAFLMDHPDGRTANIAEYLGLRLSRTRDYLKELVDECIVEAVGANKNRKYRLKR